MKKKAAPLLPFFHPSSFSLHPYTFSARWQVPQRFWCLRICLPHFGQRLNRDLRTALVRGRAFMIVSPLEQL